MFKIVKSKTIAEYEERIKADSKRIVELLDEKNNLAREIDSYKKILDELQPPEGAYLPAFEGCKTGSWCNACVYKKSFPIRKWSFNYDNISMCMRGVACKNFTSVEEDE